MLGANQRLRYQTRSWSRTAGSGIAAGNRLSGAIESFNFSGYDLVLSSSHCVAKAARAGEHALSVCYCHTPMRYIWSSFDEYFGRQPPPLRWMIGRVAARLRRWDRESASRVHVWFANSSAVRRSVSVS